MLYFIGLGLYDEKDLSLRGLEIIKKCSEVYAELYTSFFHGDLKKLEELSGKKIRVLEREDLEEKSSKLIEKAKKENVAILVPGDPMIATTHAAILIDAMKKGIKTKVVHSSSIYSGIGETGLHIYKFGRTVSLPYPQDNYMPESPYLYIKENLDLGLHTLVLLDVKAEQKKFMSINEALRILLEIEERKRLGVITAEKEVLGISRLGSDDQLIRYGAVKKLIELDFGKPPHSLVIPGKLHFMEEEMLNFFRI